MQFDDDGDDDGDGDGDGDGNAGRASTETETATSSSTTQATDPLGAHRLPSGSFHCFGQPIPRATDAFRAVSVSPHVTSQTVARQTAATARKADFAKSKFDR